MLRGSGLLLFGGVELCAVARSGIFQAILEISFVLRGEGLLLLIGAQLGQVASGGGTQTSRQIARRPEP